MKDNSRISVIIPALNEQSAIGRVLAAIPKWVDEQVVVDNGSTDATAEVARRAGARVICEPNRGYGSACLAGIAALADCDIVVFLDADFSDDPAEMPLLVDPIIRGEADLVIGSRVRGRRERGALTPQARLGNALACGLMQIFWGARFTDLGPFRAISRAALSRLDMQDRDYGWTVEMQVKAARRGLAVVEVPVSYRRRIGRSKISGTVRGVVGAGSKILWTIFRSLSASGPRAAARAPGRLVVFTRYPAPGQAKTRLIPMLGKEGAARLHRELTAATLAWAQVLRRRDGFDVEVRFDGGDAARMRECFGADWRYLPQGDGDLGARLRRAFDDAFARHIDAVIIVGTDCPAMNAHLARRGWAELEIRDLVLGPAEDGGYYLIGLRRPCPALFEQMPWGGSDLLARTLRRADELKLTFLLLPTLRDIDRPEDLSREE